LGTELLKGARSFIYVKFRATTEPQCEGVSLLLLCISSTNPKSVSPGSCTPMGSNCFPTTFEMARELFQITVDESKSILFSRLYLSAIEKNTY